MKQRPKQKWSSDKVGFSKLSTKDSDNSDEETELLNVRPAFKEIPTIEKDVKESDTLQSISIRYQCTVAELKRINQIHRENEIYAKRTIKVPIRPFSMAGVHMSGDSSPLIPSLRPMDSNLLNEMLTTVSNGGERNGRAQTDANVNDLIFNSTVVNKVPSPDVNVLDAVAEEEVHLLPSERVPAASAGALSCSGADGDLSWLALISFVLILSFAGPLIYIFYIAEHPEKYHHHHD